jgi:propionyl-CoA carboxylase alpha chain
MNTRLQVEHPVTELITGIDLVEEMIRVAWGEKLRYAQADIQLNGWAVESRIYAEDPTRNFLPSIGRLTLYRPPAEGTAGGITLRNDTGVEEGGQISMFYDPMIAKLVTHAPTRIEAIEAQARALDAFAMDGIRHNIPFLSTLMAHPRWRAGHLSTGFIAEEFPGGFEIPMPQGETARAIAAVAAVIDHRLNARKRQISGQMATTRPVRFSELRIVQLGVGDAMQRFELSVDDGLGEINVHFADGESDLIVSHWKPGDPVWTGAISGVEIAMQVGSIPNGVRLATAGTAAEARVFTPREAALAALMPEKKAADTSKSLLCPMPGLVKSVAVSEGQEVKAGETLAVVEAMKMENVLRAERDVTIGKIRAKAGESLAVDAVIMEFLA